MNTKAIKALLRTIHESPEVERHTDFDDIREYETLATLAAVGYVQIDAGDVALLLLRAGVGEAWGPRGAAAPTRLSDYRAAQQVAQDAGAGSWRTCGTLGR